MLLLLELSDMEIEQIQDSERDTDKLSLKLEMAYFHADCLLMKRKMVKVDPHSC